MSGMKRLQEAVASYPAREYGTRNNPEEKAYAASMKELGYRFAVLFRDAKWDNLFVKTQAQASEILRRDFSDEKGFKIVPIDDVIKSGQIGVRWSVGKESVGRGPFAPMALDTEQLKKFAREHDGEDSGARDVNGKPVIIGHQVDVAGFDGKFAGVRGKVLGAETRRVVLILHANGLSGQHSSNHIREE